jgi:hypothetical protein
MALRNDVHDRVQRDERSVNGKRVMRMQAVTRRDTCQPRRRLEPARASKNPGKPWYRRMARPLL